MKWHVVHIEETDSTNRWLKEHGEADMVVWADFQTAGRGCGTNTWESERGKNLLFSVMLCPPNLKAVNQFFISMAVSVALCRLAKRYARMNRERLKASIKWPNDIYINDRKLCGILIENRVQGEYIKESIIGVGLNVNQEEFLSDAPNPVSLGLLFNLPFNREVLLQEFLGFFSDVLEPVRADAVREEYRKSLYRAVGFHAYRDHVGDFEAKLVTVEDDGTLVLEDRDGCQRRYAFKEVSFII